MRARAAAALAALAALASSPANARAKNGVIPLTELPAWVREAAALTAPAGDAELVRLHEEEIVTPLPAGGVRTVHRFAARAFKPSGLEELDSWAVSYRRGDEIVSLEAWTILPDGTARAANAKDDVDDRPWISASSVFEDQRVRTIRAPAATLGTVIAFQDEVVEKLDVGAKPFTFGDDDHPTVLSRFTLRVPEGWGREGRLQRAEGIVTAEEAAGALTWTAHNLAPLPREELRPPAEEIMPAVWARWWSPDGSRGYKDWDAVARWFQDLTAAVLGEPGEAAAIGSRLKPQEPGKLLDAISRAFSFAARDVRYVSIQVGIGGYKPHSPASVCANRFGDCKDKSFLVRALTQPWGVKSYPVLVRVKESGPVAADVPTPGQFNHCIAALALPEGAGKDLWPVAEVEGLGRLLFVDATVREGNPWGLPPSDQGTMGLLVHPTGGRLITLPVQPPAAGAIKRTLAARVDEGAKLVEATLTETFSGTQAVWVRSLYAGRTDEQRRRDVLSNLQDRFAGASVADYKIEGLDNPEAAVVETTKIVGGRLGKRVGELLILEPGQGAYGVIGASLPPPPRRWPLDVGRPREEAVEITIEVPQGWSPEETPVPGTVETADITASSAWTFDAGRLHYRRSARLLTSAIPVARYAPFRKAVLDLQGQDAQAVVFVRH